MPQNKSWIFFLYTKYIHIIRKIYKNKTVRGKKRGAAGVRMSPWRESFKVEPHGRKMQHQSSQKPLHLSQNPYIQCACK